MPVLKVYVTNSSGVKAGLKKIKKAAEESLKKIGLRKIELSVLLTDNDGIQRLNKTYRGIDKSTDVLSFPMDDNVMLGDVVISMDKVLAQARECRTTADKELTRLLVHGILHLAGYDHAKGGRQAFRMREKEKEIFKGLKREKVL